MALHRGPLAALLAAPPLMATMASADFSELTQLLEGLPAAAQQAQRDPSWPVETGARDFATTMKGSILGLRRSIVGSVQGSWAVITGQVVDNERIVVVPGGAYGNVTAAALDASVDSIIPGAVRCDDQAMEAIERRRCRQRRPSAARPRLPVPKLMAWATWQLVHLSVRRKNSTLGTHLLHS